MLTAIAMQLLSCVCGLSLDTLSHAVCVCERFAQPRAAWLRSMGSSLASRVSSGPPGFMLDIIFDPSHPFNTPATVSAHLRFLAAVSHLCRSFGVYLSMFGFRLDLICDHMVVNVRVSLS